MQGDVDGLSGLARATREEWENSPSSVSPRLSRFSSGTVNPIEPAEGDPAYEELELSRLVLAASQYSAQKARIDERHEREGVDVWIGNLMLFQTDEGVVSIVAWTDECDSLLPFPDRFSFGREGTEPFELSAAEVIEAAGITSVPGLHRPRFRAARWPDAEVLRSLGAPID